MSDPVTRQEQLLSAIATGGDIISPITREEMYLAYMAGDTSVVLPEPITRKEQFLYQACLNGGGTEITDGIVVKARDADGFPTEADVYGDLYPYQFSYSGAYYHETIGWRSLSKLTLKSGQTVLKVGCFDHLPLVQLNGLEGITAIEDYCLNSTKLVEINLPNAVFGNVKAPFSGNTALKKLYCSKLTGTLTAGTNEFAGNCTALEEAVLGSVGHTVTNNNSHKAFLNCTQSGLSITVFTNAANADTLLANIRNGATNATIIIKASEDTTYNGTSYAAGETMITSTVEATT